MELAQTAVSWRLARCLDVTRELVAAMLVRTRRLGSPRTLRSNQVLSAMSDEWMREFERFDAAHGGDGR
jgi:hypothetical protein